MRRASPGFTVVEIAVALTVLSLGSAGLWYALKSSSKLDRDNRLHLAANLAARSDLESIRDLPREAIVDTAYATEGVGPESLWVERTVFDSAKVVNSLEEVILDDKLNPLELRKPLEVRVRVTRRDKQAGSDWGFTLPGSDPFAAAPEDEGRRGALATLILKLPEYRWR